MTQAAQLAQYGANNVGLSFKNRIINGDMVINQRGVTATNPNPAYVTDRWVAITYGGATVAQSSVAPAGFTNSLLWTTTSASAPSAAWTANISQAIEGFNTSDFGWGTANAQPVTLSFWVRSSVTGTYSVALGNPTSTNSLNTQARSYVATYTVNSANTWEQKTITIAGDTSGTWATTNGIGICVIFDCGAGSNYQTASTNQWLAGAFLRTAGSVNLQNSSGATWQVTGVQLEKGTVATSFDYLPYGTELQLCQRYFISYGGNDAAEQFGLGQADGTANSSNFIYLPVEMRVVPSLTVSSVNDFRVNDTSAERDISGMVLQLPSTKVIPINSTVTASIVQGRATRLLAKNINARIRLSAEL
jgi:hypothetical protein